jgi:hypothetical protein
VDEASNLAKLPSWAGFFLSFLNVAQQPITITKGDTSKVSPHFTAAEWYSTSSDAPKSHPIYPQLIAAAEFLRTHFGVAWRITSTYRTEAHERRILAELGQKFFVDQHMQGRAFDSHPLDTGSAGKAIKQAVYDDFLANGPIYTELRKIGITGFGIYDWGFHLDCRIDQFTAKRKDSFGYVACWDERTGAKKKFGGATFSQAPKAPATSATPKPTFQKSPSPAPVRFLVAPGAGPGSSSR